jgi:hypothetical protein
LFFPPPPAAGADFGAIGGRVFSLNISGEAAASLAGYVNGGADENALGDIFSWKLNFSAGTSAVKGVVNLNLTPAAQPVAIDEAYMGLSFGRADIEAGLRKLTWGRADSFGPLDVINPTDYSDMTRMGDGLRDGGILKIPRPLVRASYRIGSSAAIEGVFVPNFEPDRFAQTGRWVPADESASLPVDVPDTAALDYAQWGVRFTASLAGATDIGVQYFHGRLARAAVLTVYPPLSLTPSHITRAYNSYHQIGVDWAGILFGCNLRAEAAANITEDRMGSDGGVYNPFLAWSFGFDRDVFWGINIKAQCSETIRLLDERTNDYALFDIEADRDVTETLVIAAVSKKFFHDELEAGVTVLWGLEGKDFLLIPSVVWTKGAVRAELSGGIFGGARDGQFGQYGDNSFIKAAMKYTF